MNLLNEISYYELTPRIIEQWNNLKQNLKDSTDDLSIIQVSTGDLVRFKGDFFGLLKHVLKIEERFWYPHLIINDMNTPTDFNETMTLIKIIKTDTLEEYYNKISL